MTAISNKAQFPHVRADIRPIKYESTPCILDTESLISISIDVHDMWRSTCNPGVDTPFESDVVDIGGEHVDLANTHSRELPVEIQKISVATGANVLTMVNTCLAMNAPLHSDRIEKMSILLYGLWDVIKFRRPLSTDRMNTYYDAEARIKILDQRLALAGIASLLDSERYPVWDNYYHMDLVRELPNVRRYGEMGQQILACVRNEQKPVPINSELDYLYDA